MWSCARCRVWRQARVSHDSTPPTENDPLPGPAVVLLVAFGGICVQTGTFWPWDRVVHEDGRRTLIETILYFEHASRELLLDLVLGIAVAGAVLRFFGETTWLAGRTRRGVVGGLMALTLAVGLLVLGGTLSREGVPGLLENLAQMPTRPGAPLRWGGHWRYHLLERIATMCLSFAVAGALAWLIGHPAGTGRRGARIFGGALIVFGATTVMFGVTREPFVEAVFLGHQLRELLTHGLVTVPVALGMGLAIAAPGEGVRAAGSHRRTWTSALGCGALAVALGAYLLVGATLTGARSQGQVQNLSDLLFPHFFEHVLSYVLVMLVVGVVCLSCARRDGPGAGRA